ncbi:MAG: sugar ABC transporter ATP-binding protein [Firmicutes bacterium]|nr:sugar ABC transporter ATP-binding protein [Alicyclobacillaceae bacterium]MCL6497363.1 sugar ABC transporter ATP-binding protein [Bacillota bacterium]
MEFAIPHGEVVGLVGQNGSGKSTLVGILAGYHLPERGAEAYVDGQPASFPLSRAEVGLSFVFQDLGLVPSLTVLENLSIGQWATARGRLRPLSWRAAHREAAAALARYELELPLDRPVRLLPLRDQALLAIVRSLEELRRFQAERGTARGILVLDEPTVFLPQKEKLFLLSFIRRVAQGGAGVVFISHDLEAVLEVSTRITVLRDGQLVGHALAQDLDEARLASLVVGKREATGHDRLVAEPEQIGAPVLEAHDLWGGTVGGVDFTVHAGEVLAVAGLMGSGAEDLPRLLFGLIPGARGTLNLAGRSLDVAHLTPARAMAAGMALVPSDRKREGLALRLSVGENLMSLVLPQYFRRGRVRWPDVARSAQRHCTTFRVRPPDPGRPVGTLSGGNQQKVLVARWCIRQPRVLILHEPTQGVDVGARAEIMRIVRQQAAQGMGVLWVATDPQEMALIADRVLVFGDGRVVTELRGHEVTANAISHAVITRGRWTAQA